MGDRWRRADAVLMRTLPDGVLLLARDRAEPTWLPEPACSVWTMLDGEPCSVGHLVGALTRSYTGSAADIRADVETLLTDLADLGLVERTTAVADDD